MADLKEINVTLGGNVRKIRSSSKMTREQLAEKINVSPRFLADLEGGKVGASLTTLKSLAKTLNVSADFLLGISCPDEKNIYLDLIENKLKNMDMEALKSVNIILENIIIIKNSGSNNLHKRDD